MTDINLTITQIEDFFQNLTLQMLGLDPGANDSQSRVRIGWPEYGAPGWDIDEDVAFLLITYDDDAITRQLETTYQQLDEDNANYRQSYTRVLRVNWSCYGPNSFNDADTIRSSLYLSQFRDLLTSNNFGLITDVPQPVRAPELLNGQWWDRTSLYARFNELVVRNSTIPYLNSANVQVIPNE